MLVNFGEIALRVMDVSVWQNALMGVHFMLANCLT